MSAADIVEGGAVDMLLWCPECGMQHVDEPGGEWDGEVWRNPHHRSHLCSECGCIWRPADVPTNGVRSTGTAGKMDTFLHKAETEIRPMRLELERIGVAEIAALQRKLDEAVKTLEAINQDARPWNWADEDQPGEAGEEAAAAWRLLDATLASIRGETA